MSKDKRYGMKFKTEIGRLQYSHVASPKKNEEGQDVWEINLLFPKDSKAIEDIKKECERLAIDNFGKSGSGIKMPFLDGDEKEEYEGFPGNEVLKANSRKPVKLYSATGVELVPGADETKERFVNGNWARAVVQTCAYQVPGNKGVKLYLEKVQFAKRDEPFVSVEEIDFGPIEGVKESDELAELNL